MTKVEALQEKIAKLDREEFARLFKWVMERDGNRQIEQDAAAGKLDKVVKEAREADARGER